MTLHCESDGHGPDLVLLHGWGMHAGIWNELLPALLQHYRVMTVDLPGHGYSEPAAQGELAWWAEEVLACAPAHACWLGWSLGGLVALQAALLAPARVRALGLVAATPRFVAGPGWSEAMVPGTFSSFAQALATDATGTWQRFLALQVHGSEQARATLKRLRAVLAARPEPHPEGLAQGLSLLRSTDLRAALARLQCPLHLVLGERDTLIPPTAGPEILALITNASFEVIPGAGHAPFISHPEAMLDAIERITDVPDTLARGTV